MATTMKFGDRVSIADVRKLYDMEDVIFDRDWFEGAENMDLYYMFRDLARSDSDHELITEKCLRYDITRIPPAMLGLEYVKTVGHYHAEVPGTGFSYPEVYQVLEGSATYLLQKMDDGIVDRIVDVVVIKAKKGDCVIIPPGYGHITINSSQEVLEMANWVARDFSSIYEPIKHMSGGAYYLLRNGFVMNPSYEKVPDFRYVEPKDFPKTGLFAGKDMYDLIYTPSKLKFLTAPQDFTAFFAAVLE